MRRTLVAGSVAIAFAAAACSNMSPEDRSTAGTITGAVVGGLVGSQIGGDTTARVVAGVVGSLVGGWIGKEIAEYVNEQEAEEIRAQGQIALQTNTDTTSTRTWQSTDKTKTAVITAKPAKTKQQVAANKPKLNNLSEDFDDLPETASCREADVKLDANGKQAQQSGLYCQSQGGDYVRVADLDRA